MIHLKRWGFLASFALAAFLVGCTPAEDMGTEPPVVTDETVAPGDTDTAPVGDIGDTDTPEPTPPVVDETPELPDAEETPEAPDAEEEPAPTAPETEAPAPPQP